MLDCRVRYNLRRAKAGSFGSAFFVIGFQMEKSRRMLGKSGTRLRIAPTSLQPEI
jgi:hypothetical protein